MNNPQPYQEPNEPQPVETHHDHHHSRPWLPGVVLIALGIVFLINNVSGFELDNWWALFILIPAFDAFARAWRRYQQNGLLDRHARQPLLTGMLLTGLAAFFLFELPWAWIGPIVLIVLGLALLGNELLP